MRPLELTSDVCSDVTETCVVFYCEASSIVRIIRGGKVSQLTEKYFNLNDYCHTSPKNEEKNIHLKRTLEEVSFSPLRQDEYRKRFVKLKYYNYFRKPKKLTDTYSYHKKSIG